MEYQMTEETKVIDEQVIKTASAGGDHAEGPDKDIKYYTEKTQGSLYDIHQTQAEIEDEEDSPIEEVRLVVPK